MLHPRLLALATVLAVAATVVPTAGAPATAAEARVRYVATTGQDRGVPYDQSSCPGGGVQDPWRTLEYAFACLRAGDILYVRGGTYTERVHLIRGVSAGRADAPVLVAPHPGEHVVVRGYLRLTEASHWTVTGLEITNDGRSYANDEYLLKIRGGDGWTFAHGDIHDIASTAAARVVPAEEDRTPAPRDWRLVRNCIYRTHQANRGLMDHNLYIATARGARNGLVEGNILFDAPNGENLKLGDSRGSTYGVAENITVRFNTLYDAAQNLLVFGPSRNNRIERNLLGRVTGKSWYPNIRGFDLTGRGNVARANLGWDAGRLLFTGNDNGSTTRIADGGGNRFPRDAKFDRTDRCSGFHPRDGRAKAYGARALDNTSFAGVALAGDWNGDGVDTPGFYDDGWFRLRNSNGVGWADVSFYYGGRPGDLPLVGDWDGDGVDTVGIVRDGTWHLVNSFRGGSSDISFHYGRVTRGDVPITGDWDGDGIDDPGIIRDGTWHLRTSHAGGPSDISFHYGRITRGDLPVVGDWDRDGIDEAGIVRDGTWHLIHRHRGGGSDVSFTYGRVTRGDIPVTGDWTGEGADTAAIVRDSVTWMLRHRNTGGAADAAYVYAR